MGVNRFLYILWNSGPLGRNWYYRFKELGYNVEYKNIYVKSGGNCLWFSYKGVNKRLVKSFRGSLGYLVKLRYFIYGRLFPRASIELIPPEIDHLPTNDEMLEEIRLNGDYEGFKDWLSLLDKEWPLCQGKLTEYIKTLP